jgi:hypothetical protein
MTDTRAHMPCGIHMCTRVCTRNVQSSAALITIVYSPVKGRCVAYANDIQGRIWLLLCV